ncbi:MAG: hypothetical protein ACJ0S4_00315 [Candidatus Rariloculaceae bacterium]
MIKKIYYLFFALASPTLLAHHGAVTNPVLYQADNFVELEGVMTEMFWHNPHVRGRMTVVDEAGEEIVYELELGPGPPGMANRGLTEEDFLGPVRVAGYPSKRKINTIGILHVLMPSGREIVQGNREPLWAEELPNAQPDVDPILEAEERLTARSIFRTWTKQGGMAFSPEANDLANAMDWLSERGHELNALYDPIADNVEVSECKQGMPDYMFDPGQMRIDDEGDRIIFESWEYNGIRTIYMDTATAPEPEPSNVGYSTGRWFDDTLVVTTTHIDFPYWAEFGLPQSNQGIIVERFTPSDDGNNLSYTLTVIDPVTMTRPFTVRDNRFWTPGREILPYDCVVEWED